ncbi:hypothetical protein HMI55_005053, partial [Coelomomyces lativittatus]
WITVVIYFQLYQPYIFASCLLIESKQVPDVLRLCYLAVGLITLLLLGSMLEIHVAYLYLFGLIGLSFPIDTFGYPERFTFLRYNESLLPRT